MKPAVFDLVLTLCISAYLGLVYLAVVKSKDVYRLMASLALVSNASSGSPAGSPAHKANGNGVHGNGKIKGH